ncbi:MAG: SAM hydrolase/SAM-dependent halogenase family protein [Candidatus Cyclobacteriaceae bacterium M3_2C_046]
MSDLGTSDHYVAAVKAKILQSIPDQQIVDISHNIEHFNLVHGSFVLKSVFRNFPAGTIHIASLNDLEQGYRFIALHLEGHFFVGPDNGLFSLLSSKPPEQVVDISTTMVTTFPALDYYAPTAIKLAQGVSLQELGYPIDQYKQLINRQVRATKQQINGHVIRVNHFGNLITNIEQEVFNILNKSDQFTIIFSRHRFNQIHQSYFDTEAGDCYIFFNHLGLLEVGINQGNASELLGMECDSPVTIQFHI